MALDLRPLTLGELFDRAFVLYRRHFWLFVGITAIPGVFALVVALAQQAMQNVAATNTASGVDPTENAVFALWLAAGVIVAALAYAVVYTISLGATTYAVSEIYMGRTATIAEVYAKVRPRIGRLILLMLAMVLRIGGVLVLGSFLAVFGAGVTAIIHPIVSGIVAVLCFLAMFAGMAVLSLRYSLAVPSMILEGLWARSSLQRSVELTRGRLGRVFLLLLCAAMVTYATALLFQGPFMFAAFAAGLETRTGMWLNIVAAFTGTIGTTLTAPFMIIGLALLYYDARIREEGFDLELALVSLDSGSAASVRG
jgi:hypothetical protein